MNEPINIAYCMLYFHWIFCSLLVHENKDCLLPKDSGTCLALFVRYYYDWQQKRCARFNYGGCQGNDNNFASLKKCEQECKGKLNIYVRNRPKIIFKNSYFEHKE